MLELRTASRRRVFPPTLSVHHLEQARPLGPSSGKRPAAGITAAVAAWTQPVATPGLTRPWDWHLRRELAVRLLEQAAATHSGAFSPVLVVLTRSGPAEREDGDAEWWAATCTAAADVRVPVRFLVVVTRWGWWTLPEGPEHYWDRLRDRRVHAPPAGSVPVAR